MSGSAAESGVPGGMIDALATIGIETDLDADARYHIAADLGAERLATATRSSAIHAVTAERISMSVRGPKPDIWPRSAPTFEARLGLAGWPMNGPPTSANGAELSASLAAVFGCGSATLSIGPELGGWDMQRAGRALSAGVEVGGRVSFDPRRAW